MKLIKDRFEYSGGSLAYRIYEPEGEIRAVVQISHGMCEYVGRYEEYAEHLCSLGIVLAGNDHPGHGESAASDADFGYFAKENGVALRCTAAVGGGIPWLINLERCRRIDTVTEVSGIMNGTTNYIMDAMHKSPVAFADILKRAQELGYAEADPSADIDGDDIRRKLTISANIAFGALLN